MSLLWGWLCWVVMTHGSDINPYLLCILLFSILTRELHIWDTNYNSDNWEPEFRIIFVTWHLRVTLKSIWNSCAVFIWILKKSISISLPDGQFFKVQIGVTLIKCSTLAHKKRFTMIVLAQKVWVIAELNMSFQAPRPKTTMKEIFYDKQIYGVYGWKGENSFSYINSNYSSIMRPLPKPHSRKIHRKSLLVR